MKIDDFRRQINAGLRRQGYAPIWRPKRSEVGECAHDQRPERPSRYDCQQRNPEAEDGENRQRNPTGGLGSGVGGGYEKYSPTHRQGREGPEDGDREGRLGRSAGYSARSGIAGKRFPSKLRPVSPATQHGNPRLGREAYLPHLPPVERSVRRRMYRLRYYLRPINRPRIRACGFAIVADAGRVGVTISDEGKAKFDGLANCGSVWECPCCQMVIKARRAEEVRTVVEAHGAGRVAMLTLTIRHGVGDDLKKLRRSLADAWRGFTRGAAYQRFKKRHGVEGAIRALEVTHGDNGWHPHIHVLLLLKRPFDELEVFPVDGHDRWVPRDVGWVIDRWSTMVERYVGAAHVPDDSYGVTLTPCRAADYVSKLGLELSDPGVKRGRSKGRTPLQIASDFADASAEVRAGRLASKKRKARDRWLWCRYAEAMRGARQLTWTRDLKKRFGIDDRTDREVAQDEEPSVNDDVVIGTLTAEQWKTIRARRVNGTPASYYVLACAERGGGPGLRKAVADVVEGRVGIVGA